MTHKKLDGEEIKKYVERYKELNSGEKPTLKEIATEFNARYITVYRAVARLQLDVSWEKRRTKDKKEELRNEIKRIRNEDSSLTQREIAEKIGIKESKMKSAILGTPWEDFLDEARILRADSEEYEKNRDSRRTVRIDRVLEFFEKNRNATIKEVQDLIDKRNYKLVVSGEETTVQDAISRFKNIAEADNNMVMAQKLNKILRRQQPRKEDRQK